MYQNKKKIPHTSCIQKQPTKREKIFFSLSTKIFDITNNKQPNYLSNGNFTYKMNEISFIDNTTEMGFEFSLGVLAFYFFIAKL